MQLLPEAVLVAAALGLLGTAVASERKSGLSFPAGSAAAMAAVGVILAGLALLKVPAPDSVTPLLTSDPLARLFKGIVLGLGLLAVLLPPAEREIRQTGEYFSLMLFALVGLLLAVGTNHLLFLFVSLELASLSLYLLVGFTRTARASEASLKYFLFGGVSAAFLLFGLSLVYGFGIQSHLVPGMPADVSNGSTLGGISRALTHAPSSPLAMAGLAMVLVGLGFKLAAAPFHYWAPDVYQGGPATSVALVSAASKAVGMVVLVRILLIGYHAAGGSSSWGQITAGWSVWLAVLSAVSMVFGNLLAMAQKSVRRLLAYSAVANTGYLLVGICANGSAAAGAALFYVVVYGLATLGALAVTAAVERSHGDDSPRAFAGLVHRSPLQAVALFVFMASLAGIPPLAGFVGKFAVFSSAMAAVPNPANPGITWLVGLAAVMSAVSLYYYLLVLKQAFVKDATEDGPVSLPFAHALAVGLPAVAIVILGLFPALLLEPISRAVADTLAKL